MRTKEHMQREAGYKIAPNFPQVRETIWAHLTPLGAPDGCNHQQINPGETSRGTAQLNPDK